MTLLALSSCSSINFQLLQMEYIFLELELGVIFITKANSLLEIAFNGVILQTQSCVLRMKVAAAPSFVVA